MSEQGLFSSKHISELFQKALYTLALLIVFRIGSFVPVPCIDSVALFEISSKNQMGFLGMFNMLSGGALGRMSIFALAIMPYITASIIIQLLSMIYKPLDNLKKEGESGRKKINQLSRYLTIFLATIEAYIAAVNLENLVSSAGQVVIISGIFFKICTVVTLVTGTTLLVWIGEQITSRGIGNGSSMIIFVGIVSGLPSSLISLFELSRTGVVSYFNALYMCAMILSMLAFVVFVERSFRKVLIHTPQKKIQNLTSSANYLPIKLNIAGVIPPMFASSVLFLPATIISFYQTNGKVAEWFFYNFARGKPLFILAYVFLIFFFGFFYSAIVFNSEEVANNLKKSGAFIPGKRPGVATAEYFDYLIVRITSIGSLYLVVICIVPELLITQMVSLSFSGTSLLICVSVIMDTFAQIQSHSMNRQYGALVKKIRFR